MSDKVKKIAEVNDNEKKIAEVSDNEKIKKCFIITPIGNDTDPIRRHVDGVFDAAIAPVLNEYSYEPLLPHRLAIPGSINKQIVQMIHDSDLVIANLTGKNPNVMYELALRHCFGTPAIMIAEKGTELPFDINNQRTIFYVNDAQGVLNLQASLREVLETLKEDGSYESPIFSVLGDMKIEEQIIEKTKEKDNKNDSNILELILSRLDRIENNFRSKKVDKDIRQYEKSELSKQNLSINYYLFSKDTSKDLSSFEKIVRDLASLSEAKVFFSEISKNGLNFIVFFNELIYRDLFDDLMCTFCDKENLIIKRS